jgi:hypothetical protein
MISRASLAILDQAGITVVQAVYAKALTVRRLPGDYAEPVEFSHGTVQLGEVDEWLQKYARNQSDEARRTRRRSAISIGISLFGTFLGIVGIVIGLMGYLKRLRRMMAVARIETLRLMRDRGLYP